MNRLPLEDRVRILAALCRRQQRPWHGPHARRGQEDRPAPVGDVGDACDVYLDQHVRGLQSQRIQCDEIWSFCHAKQRNLLFEKRGDDGVGRYVDVDAIDADTKLIVSCTSASASATMRTCSCATWQAATES
jgi:hypothetical protein